MTKPEFVGVRFPFVNLEKALERAEQLYTADRRGRPLAIPTAFSTWGYSEKSSGGHQTIAALKMYGLITDSGVNADRRVALSPEALRYFVDEREDERKKLLQSFALNPKLFAVLWRDWGASPPSDNIARSHLKIDRKLNEQSARSVLSIYKDNVAFAELDKSATVQSPDPGPNVDEPEEEEEDEREPAVVGDLIQWSPGGVDQLREPARVRAVAPDGEWLFIDGSETGIPMTEVEVVGKSEPPRQAVSITPAPRGRAPTLPLPPAGPELKRDVFSLEEGEATITFPATLSRASYDDLVDWLELVKRRAERAVKSSEASS